MDTDKLKALLAAIRCGNLSEAAQELGYTPSGMSRMMASLENETGLRLLLRSRNGVAATADCLRLLPSFRSLVQLADNVEQEMAELSGAITGEVRVATAYAIYYRPFSDLIGAFCKRYPGIRVDIREGRSSALMKEIEARSLDFCLISKRDGACEWIPLFDDPFYAWVPSDHPAAARGVYKMKEFESDPYIELYPGKESDASRIFDGHGIRPNTRYTTSDTYAAYSMVEAGLGVAAANGLFRNLWSGDVVSLPLSPSVSVPIGIAVTSADGISPAAKKFRDFAVAFFFNTKGREGEEMIK